MGPVPYHVVAHAQPPNPSFFVDQVLVQASSGIPPYVVDPTVHDSSVTVTYWLADSDPSTAQTRTFSQHLDQCTATMALPQVYDLEFCDGTLRVQLTNQRAAKINAEFVVAATGFQGQYAVAPGTSKSVDIPPSIPNPVTVYEHGRYLVALNPNRQPSCAAGPAGPTGPPPPLPTASLGGGGGRPPGGGSGAGADTASLPVPTGTAESTNPAAPVTASDSAVTPGQTQALAGVTPTSATPAGSLLPAVGIGAGLGSIALVGVFAMWRIRRRRLAPVAPTEAAQ